MRQHLCQWLHLLYLYRCFPMPQSFMPPAPLPLSGLLSRPQLPALWRGQAALSVWSAWRLRYKFLLLHIRSIFYIRQCLILISSYLSVCPGSDHLSALWSCLLLSGVQQCNAGVSSVSQQHIAVCSYLPWLKPESTSPY